jgi:hypothetical protein
MVNYRPLGGFSLMFYGQLEEKALQVVLNNLRSPVMDDQNSGLFYDPLILRAGRRLVFDLRR